MKKSLNIYKIVSIFFSLFFSFFIFLLFYLQCRNPENEKYYFSDMFLQIDFFNSGKNLYSLMYIILGTLNSLPYMQFTIPICLTAFILFSIYITYLLLDLLISYSNDSCSLKNVYNTPNGIKWNLLILAWIINISYPMIILYLPRFGHIGFSGILNFNVYHNPTYIGMKPFALYSVYAFLKVIYNYTEEKITLKNFIFLTVSILLATCMKPNFTVGFAITMLIILIFDFIKHRGKFIINYVLIGLTVIPSVVLILFQQFALFESPSEGINVGLYSLKKILTNFGYIGIIESVIFAVIVFIILYKDIFLDKIAIFSILNFSVNLLIYLFLYESGERMGHDNFIWGLYFASGILWIFSVSKYYLIIQKRKMKPIIVLSGVLSLQLFSGINYLFYLLCGNLPY